MPCGRARRPRRAARSTVAGFGPVALPPVAGKKRRTLDRPSREVGVHLRDGPRIDVRQRRVVVDAVIDNGRFVESVSRGAPGCGTANHDTVRANPRRFSARFTRSLPTGDVDSSNQWQATEGDLRHAHVPQAICRYVAGAARSTTAFSTELSEIAAIRLRRAKSRHVDIKHPRAMGQTFGNVMAARSVLGEPVVAEVDDGEVAQRDGWPDVVRPGRERWSHAFRLPSRRPRPLSPAPNSAICAVSDHTAPSELL